jgi:integrase
VEGRAYLRAMGRIYRRGKTLWYQAHNKRVSLKTTDRKAAELKARELERERADPTYRSKNSTTVGAALNAFAARQEQRGRSQATMSMYSTHASHITRLLGADSPLASVDAEAVDDYLAARHREGAKRSTQWKELCTLRGTLKLARRHKKYPHPLDEVMPESFEGAQSEPGTRHLLMPGVLKLVAVLTKPRADVVRFIVGTAADWVGVERARDGDIDWSARQVKVFGSKTDFRQRTVPILDVFEDLLREVRLPLEPWGNVRRDLEVACRRAGVPRVTPRDLRRSCSRILRAAGVEPSLIAPMLGHKDERMVVRTYGRIQPDELGAAIGRRLSTGTKSVQKPKKRRKKAAA